jgi:leucyl-tRNA synthetase
MKYEPGDTEPKWQKKWLEERIYEPDLDTAKKPFYSDARAAEGPSAGGRSTRAKSEQKGTPFYNLMMFPYPSAEGLHVGNMYAFTGSDIYGRMKRMQGYDVFEPIGLDGFGIHSENYAIKMGTHPAEQAKESEKHFYEQLQKIGNGFAWDERVETYKPEYYRWTQWLFREMWKRDLAYRKKQSVNWCPKDKTVLADEQVENGKCERCGTEVEKRDLEQWFFRITKYSGMLLDDLEKLDWSEKVKVAQKNWIGRSEGAEIKFAIADGKSSVAVFTTRPDTLFGATYLVLAPEHPLLEDGRLSVTNRGEVGEYISEARLKKEAERVEEGKEKTGVELKGVKAINPANNEEIPVWVADYVLGSYGTGAIMAVPAHDERDFAFAKKFELPIREVIAEETGIRHENEERRDGGCGVIFDPETQKYAVATHHDGLVRLFAGGVGGEESLEQGVLREITEESGLYDFGRVEKVRSCFAHYYNSRKKVYRSAFATCFLVILKSDAQKEPKLEPHEKGFELAWMTPREIVQNWNSHNERHDIDHWFIFLREAVARAIELGVDRVDQVSDFNMGAFMGEGMLFDSGKFSGMDSETVKWEIAKFVHGERKTQYRLRDWLISRQRYWGPPIPMIFCEACAKAGNGEHKDMPGWYAVDEEDLPVLLPYIEDFRPTGSGVSPLAADREFYEVKCPACGAPARRETDVSDTFLDSAWYYLRYLDAHNEKSALNAKRIKRWLPAALYTGGAEHSVLHLLYVRFVAMALHDAGLLDFEEPFTKFRAHGLIIKDGAKMSKSKGNIINPDEYIKNFGADTLRMCLMFLAPFEQGGDFRDSGVLGIERFLKRVWNFAAVIPAKAGIQDSSKEKPGFQIKPGMTDSAVLLHKTIKKVTEDIEDLHYNTAISALMILLNGFEENGAARGDFEIFVKLLAPFAPHMTEEIWRETLGHKTSIHREPWPKYDPKLLIEETVTIVLQVNGKMRDTISMSALVTEPAAKEAALASEKVKRAIGSTTPKRIIYVDKKLVNIVI